MTYGPTTEQKAEAIARRLAKERGIPESMWEICLVDAYMELFQTTKQPDRQEPS